MDHVLAPNGRIIIFVGAEETESRWAESTIATEIPVHGRVEIPHPVDNRLVRRLFWIDGPDT
jgi:hypothetical protein